MARPAKRGLDYFPLDVDIFDDPKVQFVTARFGAKGDGVFIRLLCKIYREGYALHFDDDTALLVARSVGDIGLHGLVMDVVHELLKRGFFDRSIFEKFGLLTSHGIQKRYLKICTSGKRSGYEIPTHLLLTPEETPLTPEETPKNTEFSTQSKVKESKEKNNTPFIPLEGEKAKNAVRDITVHTETELRDIWARFTFSPILKASITDWLDYKSEKKQSYKPKGLQGLLSKISKHAEEYGETAIAELIGESIANNWQGIVWEHLKRRPKAITPQEFFRRKKDENSGND